MTTRRRQLLVLLLLLLGLLAAVLIVPPSGERLPALSVYSNSPGGGRALRLWLEALRYEVEALESTPFLVPPGAGTLLLLAPSTGLPSTEVDAVVAWVQQGGRLVVATDESRYNHLLRRFGLAVVPLAELVERATSVPDAGLDPRLDEVVVRATDALRVSTSQPAQPLLRSGEHLLGVRVAHGRGEVLALSAPAALTNRALHDEGNARLALSLVGPPGRVAFDELHHGFGARRGQSIWNLGLDHTWGRTALGAGAIVLLYLLLSGRRFGRAVPLIHQRRRSLGEYVTSLAALYRAGGKRAFVADHFRRRLRRDAAQALGLPATATDEQLEAAARSLGRDPLPALRVLRALDQPAPPNELALVSLVRDGERATRLLAREKAT